MGGGTYVHDLFPPQGYKVPLTDTTGVPSERRVAETRTPDEDRTGTPGPASLGRAPGQGLVGRGSRPAEGVVSLPPKSPATRRCTGARSVPQHPCVDAIRVS